MVGRVELKVNFCLWCCCKCADFLLVAGLMAAWSTSCARLIGRSYIIRFGMWWDHTLTLPCLSIKASPTCMQFYPVYVINLLLFALSFILCFSQGTQAMIDYYTGLLDSAANLPVNGTCFYYAISYLSFPSMAEL